MQTGIAWVRQRWQRFRAEHELGWEFRVVAVCAVVFVATMLVEFVVVDFVTELLILISGLPLLLATLYRILANLKMRRPDGDDAFASPRERGAKRLTQGATKPTRR